MLVSGILLRVTPHGETSQILRVYTEELGAVSIMYKGAKRKKSLLQLSDIVECDIRRRTDSGLYMTFSVLQPVRSFDFSKDILRLALRDLALEMGWRCSVDELPVSGLLKLYQRYFTYLQEVEPGGEFFALWLFLIRFLALFGYALDLSICSSCGASIDRGSFSLDRGVFKGECCHRGRGKLFSGDLRLLLLRGAKDPERILSDISFRERCIFTGAIVDYWQYHSGQSLELKSLRFLFDSADIFAV